MPQQNKQVTKRQTNNLPDYLVSEGALGTEDIGTEDIVIPRLKIAQGLSKVHDINEKIKNGHWYNSVTSEHYGLEVSFYILLKWNSVVWFDDGKFKATEFTEAGTGQVRRIAAEGFNLDDPKVYETGIRCFNYMIVLEKDLDEAFRTKVMPDILIYTAGSAAQKPARNLNGKLKANGKRQIPIFGQLITATTVKEKFKKGDAFMPNFSFGDYPPEDKFNALKVMFDECQKLQTKDSVHTKIDEEEEGEDEVLEKETPFE